MACWFDGLVGQRLERDLPKASVGVALTFEDGLLVIKNLHSEFGEAGLKIVVTELADQDEGTVVKIGENVCLTSFDW